MEGIKLGNKKSKYPIIQGGMGVGVSMHNLAGNVSKEGGIGIISTADIGYKEKDFDNNPNEANIRAIGKEIKLAREIAGEDKILGVNIMVALKRCCKLIVKHWMDKYNYIPDMIVIEGPKAGGHLGFKNDELVDNKVTLENITVEIVNYIKKIEEQTKKNIPIISAGGIWDKNDIEKFLKLGSTGVQMATRFVATDECDASIEFKNMYVNAKKEDIKIIKSPVGMPGRALNNSFIKNTELEKCKIDRCYGCIKTCDVSNTPYCITKALVNAVKGNMRDGLIFCGSNVDKVNKIVSVHELMQELTN